MRQNIFFFFRGGGKLLVLEPNEILKSDTTEFGVGCPILAKCCKIILPQKNIVGNIFIKPCTDFQLFSHLS